MTQKPSERITVPTGNVLDYEWLFNEIIAILDEQHAEIEALKAALLALNEK